MRVAGKMAFITGGASGLGRASAHDDGQGGRQSCGQRH